MKEIIESGEGGKMTESINGWPILGPEQLI